MALVRSLMSTGAFGDSFPDECPDGRGPVGTNEHTFQLALRAEIPEVPWPLQPDEVPPTLAVLDMVQFCYHHVAKPEAQGYHSFFDHKHLTFDRDEGRRDFRARIERIFSRNALAYELKEDGSVERLAPEGLREALRDSTFNTGDRELDGMLEAARAKFLSPDPAVRRESLEKLWDAFERLKSLDDGNNKKASVEALLKRASPEGNFRARLDAEARELTGIGNSFQIRHAETNQVAIALDAHVDYLFHRLFALLQLLGRRDRS